MRIINGIKTILSLLSELRSMSPADKEDFRRSKCEYYQGIVELGLVVSSLVTLCFVYSDYMINGTLRYTLLPRLSILFFLVVFYIVTHFPIRK